jgi:hypothetical protein
MILDFLVILVAIAVFGFPVYMAFRGQPDINSLPEKYIEDEA